MNDTIPALGQFIEPSPVRFYPSAPGWHVLAGIILLMLAGIVVFAFHRYRKNRYRRFALRWLEQEEQKYIANKEYDQLIYIANLLAKQICTHLTGNNQALILRGSDWLTYLSQTCPTLSFSSSEEEILKALYESPTGLSQQQAVDFSDKIKHWIKKHRIKS